MPATIVAAEGVRCGLAAEIAVGAIPIDVISAWSVGRVAVDEARHGDNTC